jgi:hypothetical protein
MITELFALYGAYKLLFGESNNPKEEPKEGENDFVGLLMSLEHISKMFIVMVGILFAGLILFGALVYLDLI